MAYIQFRKLWGEDVIVERRNGDTIVGTIAGEDFMFVYVENGKLVRDHKSIEVPYAVVSKRSISMVRGRG
jgi:small nuclear ribonucleoprotein (snRNP)-like protein